MKLFEKLTEDVFVLFAARHYYNPSCIDAEEFHEDLKRFKYVKRLLNRYISNGNLNERLILNHLIVVFNVFTIPAGLKMIEHRITEQEHWEVLKPFLIYLQVITNDKYTNVSMDKKVIEALRTI